MVVLKSLPIICIGVFAVKVVVETPPLVLMSVITGIHPELQVIGPAMKGTSEEIVIPEPLLNSAFQSILETKFKIVTVAVSEITSR